MTHSHGSQISLSVSNHDRCALAPPSGFGGGSYNGIKGRIALNRRFGLFLFPEGARHMATEKQIEANRRNAQKSTGPTTAEGKSKAKFNALKHGMTADTAVLPYEDPHSYEQMRQALIAHYEPANAGEHMLVELVVANYWRLLRARRVEAASMILHI